MDLTGAVPNKEGSERTPARLGERIRAPKHRMCLVGETLDCHGREMTCSDRSVDQSIGSTDQTSKGFRACEREATRGESAFSAWIFLLMRFEHFGHFLANRTSSDQVRLLSMLLSPREDVKFYLFISLARECRAAPTCTKECGSI